MFCQLKDFMCKSCKTRAAMTMHEGRIERKSEDPLEKIPHLKRIFSLTLAGCIISDFSQSVGMTMDARDDVFPAAVPAAAPRLTVSPEFVSEIDPDFAYLMKMTKRTKGARQDG